MLTIGDVSARTGLAVSAIRFYEDQGLVHPHRSAGGHRLFERADIRRLSFVMVAQDLGFPLSQIRRELASLPRDRAPTKADWTRIGRGFRKVLDDRIRRMELLRDRLDGCIGCGCLSLKTCRLHNPDDLAGRSGTGPRNLEPQKADAKSRLTMSTGIG